MGPILDGPTADGKPMHQLVAPSYYYFLPARERITVLWGYSIKESVFGYTVNLYSDLHVKSNTTVT